MECMETDRDLAVYKAICRLPLQIEDIEALLEISAGEIISEHALDANQIATLTAHLSSEIQRYKMASVSSAHHHPRDEDLERIL